MATPLPFNPAAHANLLALGYSYLRVEPDGDVPEYDCYTDDDSRVFVDADGTVNSYEM